VEKPIGVILAGGRGSRIGGSKALVSLRGRPLVRYPLGALREVLDDVVVLAKADTELPSLPGVEVWIEADRRHHPLIGIVEALALAGGRPVLVCAVDLPFVTSELVRRLAASERVTVAGWRGAIQPLLGRYDAWALEALSGQLGPAQEVVRELRPDVVDVGDPRELFNVNSPADVLQAAGMLERKGA
jgi:molybdopterin-guanine dinucleotide biosynthesis protein A